MNVILVQQTLSEVLTVTQIHMIGGHCQATGHATLICWASFFYFNFNAYYYPVL